MNRSVAWAASFKAVLSSCVQNTMEINITKVDSLLNEFFRLIFFRNHIGSEKKPCYRASIIVVRILPILWPYVFMLVGARRFSWG